MSSPQCFADLLVLLEHLQVPCTLPQLELGAAKALSAILYNMQQYGPLNDSADQ